MREAYSSAGDVVPYWTPVHWVVASNMSKSRLICCCCCCVEGVAPTRVASSRVVLLMFSDPLVDVDDRYFR